MVGVNLWHATNYNDSYYLHMLEREGVHAAGGSHANAALYGKAELDSCPCRPYQKLPLFTPNYFFVKMQVKTGNLKPCRESLPPLVAQLLKHTC